MIQIIEQHPFLSLFFAFWLLAIVIFIVFIWLYPDEMIEKLDEDWKEGKEHWR